MIEFWTSRSNLNRNRNAGKLNNQNRNSSINQSRKFKSLFSNCRSQEQKDGVNKMKMKKREVQTEVKKAMMNNFWLPAYKTVTSVGLKVKSPIKVAIDNSIIVFGANRWTSGE